jgi:hypothetical protein
MAWPSLLRYRVQCRKILSVFQFCFGELRRQLGILADLEHFTP